VGMKGSEMMAEGEYCWATGWLRYGPSGSNVLQYAIISTVSLYPLYVHIYLTIGIINSCMPKIQLAPDLWERNYCTSRAVSVYRNRIPKHLY